VTVFVRVWVTVLLGVRLGKGVRVDVWLGVRVTLGVDVIVPVGVKVEAGVRVAVAVAVRVIVLVNVAVRVGVALGGGVRVDVPVPDAVAVGASVALLVGVPVRVGVGLDRGVRVDVALAAGVIVRVAVSDAVALAVMLGVAAGAVIVAVGDGIGCQLPVQSPSRMATKSCALTGEARPTKLIAPDEHIGAICGSTTACPGALAAAGANSQLEPQVSAAGKVLRSPATNWRMRAASRALTVPSPVTSQART
jgi:hypothetical protein